MESAQEPIQHRIPAGEWSLAASEYPAVGDANGVVIVGHAAACNRRTLDRPRGKGLVSTLAEAGLHVYTFDVRGHGESGPIASENGRWGYEDILEGDLSAVISWVHERHPQLRLGVLGHSLTGHGTLLWLGLHPEAPVDALVLYSTNLWMPQFEAKRSRWLKKRSILTAWALMSRVIGYLPARRLRAGTDDESGDMIRDFYRWAKTDQCLRLSDGADYLDGRQRVKQPVLAYVGEHDRLLCTEDGCRRFLAPVPEHTIHVVPGGDHMSLVTKERSRPIWQETAAFFVDKLASSDVPAAYGSGQS